MSKPKITFEAFPLGICAECLKQWKAGGLPGQVQEVGSAVSILTGYCAHREAGFWASVDASGVVTEWTIRVPIAIEAWKRYIAALPVSLRGVQAAVVDFTKSGAENVH